MAVAVIGVMVLSGGGDEEKAATLVSSPVAAITAVTPQMVIDLIPTASPTAADTPLPTDTLTPTETLTPRPVIEIIASPTLTPTEPPTLSNTEKEATIQAEMAAVQTATATHWTLTPSVTPTPTLTPTATEDLQATALARLAQTQAALDATSTAAMWTDTPTITATATQTPSPTPTPTQTPTQTPTATFTPTSAPDPLLAALERAWNFTGSNTDWQPFVRNFDGVEMVLVPAGCFMMGSTVDVIAALIGQGDTGSYINESPWHKVCFEEPFWIDRTEVTNKQFETFNGQAANILFYAGDTRPREQISWAEALAFCESRGARLPTEAEWEYVARGPDGWEYAWGDQFLSDNLIWANANGQPAEVGSRSGGVSWVGALDMNGNVWEWVLNWIDTQYYGTLAAGVVNPNRPGFGRVPRVTGWLVAGNPPEFPTRGLSRLGSPRRLKR